MVGTQLRSAMYQKRRSNALRLEGRIRFETWQRGATPDANATFDGIIERLGVANFAASERTRTRHTSVRRTSVPSLAVTSALPDRVASVTRVEDLSDSDWTAERVAATVDGSPTLRLVVGRRRTQALRRVDVQRRQLGLGVSRTAAAQRLRVERVIAPQS